MNESATSLDRLGWGPFFQQQLTLEDLETSLPARVFEVQLTGLTLLHEGGESSVSLGGRWFQLEAEQRPTVGDWVLLNHALDSLQRVLERKSLLKRLAAGSGNEIQLIGANVDTMFLVSSCNDEFNLSRMERYLSLAYDAGVQPVIVLTKADLCDDSEYYVAEVRRLKNDLVVELVNALDIDSLASVAVWVQPGQTIALLGSSGVGKSTLLNTLSGVDLQVTKDIREDDSRGRHTTTHRSLHLLSEGGILLDSPGIRELSLAEAESGVLHMFDDIEALAEACRFSDCAHESEPDCAVRAAIVSGDLEERRLSSYRKLASEELRNTESVAERHSRFRAFSKSIRQHVDKKKRE
ncbi:MAG: ribosome small subunit-dependent GTPase A [Gammaproteobacteria bacterium]|nr:ribosome small subunit-dependent GTPase A [Gammaproteobacteria bacterium]